MRIFLSYSSTDRALAEEVYLALAAGRRSVFFDKENLPPGSDYNAKLRIALKQSDLFVFLVSPASISKRSYALTELRYAQDKWPHPKNHVLPVVVTAVPKLPAYLNSVVNIRPEGSVPAEVLRAVSDMESRIRPRRPTTTTPRRMARYYEYLDRESTSMGQLCLFSLILVLVFTGLRYAPQSAERVSLAAGMTSAFAAALLFYLQKSHLLWLRGQLALAVAQRNTDAFTVDDWLTFADGWGTWVRYRAAWTALLLAGAYWIVQVAVPLSLPFSPRYLWSPLLAAAAWGFVQWDVYTRFSDSERPFHDWFTYWKERVTRASGQTTPV